MAMKRCLTSIVLGLALLGKTALTAAKDDAAINENLLKWFTAQGGVIDGVTVNQFDGMGRGVQATKSLSSHDMVLKMPLTMVVSRATAIATATTDAARYIYEDMEREEDVIALFIMREKARGAASEWAPYIDALPEFIPQAAYFPRSAFEKLQDKAFAQQASERGQGISKRFKKLQDNIEELVDDLDAQSQKWFASEPAYKWALAVVSSRALTFRGKRYLAPIADMFNYSPHPDTRKAASGEFFLTHHVLDTSPSPSDGDGAGIGPSLTIHADRDTAAGEQLFEDYGDNTNQIYIDHHGFVPDHNPFECVYTRLSVPSNDGVLHTDLARSARLELLKIMQVPTEPAPCIRNGHGASWPTQAFTWLQVMTLTDVEAKRCTMAVSNRRIEKSCPLIAGYGGYGGGGLPDSWEPSVEQLSMILPGASARVGSFPSTYESDLSLIRQQAPSKQRLTYEEALSVKYRIAQKKVALDLVASLEAQIDGKAWDYHTKSSVEQSVETSVEVDAMGEPIEPASAVGDSVGSGSGSGSGCVAGDEECELNDAIAMFNAWIEKANFPVQKIKAERVPGMRIGTIATEEIQPEEVYLSVPPEVVMNVDSARASAPLNEFVGAVSRSRDGAFFILLMHLLHERFVLGESSAYWPYLRLLPTLEEIHPPITYDGHEMGLLDGSDLKASIKRMDKLVGRHWDGLKQFASTVSPIFAENGGLSEAQFRWAHYILDSRCIWWGGGRHLVPLLDLINCNEGPDPTRIHSTNLDDAGTNALTKADRHYPKGSQLFENYGQPNHTYLQYHGFVLESNTHDCTMFSIEVNQADVRRLNGDSSIIRRRMREGGFNSGIQTFCVGGGGKTLEDDARLRAWLAIKFGHEGSDYVDVVDDFKGLVEERLSLYPDPNTYDDAMQGHVALKLVGQEKAMLNTLLTTMA